jgi:hypothetical protein
VWVYNTCLHWLLGAVNSPCLRFRAVEGHRCRHPSTCNCRAKRGPSTSVADEWCKWQMREPRRNTDATQKCLYDIPYVLTLCPFSPVRLLQFADSSQTGSKLCAVDVIQRIYDVGWDPSEESGENELEQVSSQAIYGSRTLSASYTWSPFTGLHPTNYTLILGAHLPVRCFASAMAHGEEDICAT